ncbi:MAG: hypothetical protein OQJ98_03160 [Candidatus Pacebacteria bacterium]|nr:hypothetical protein [Candidatus Paceibacterota bacterium]
MYTHTLNTRSIIILASLFVLSLTLLFVPTRAHALKPFGGQVGAIIPCMGGSIHATVGPPVGGAYIWTPGTRTYLFGPPSPGRWVLGNAAGPGICVVSINPPIFFTGLVMVMVGSSGI